MAEPKPIDLAAYRLQRRLAAEWEADIAAREASATHAVKPTYLAAEAGLVRLAFSDGAQLDLSPEHARTWAERLAAMADVADAMAKAGRGGA